MARALGSQGRARAACRLPARGPRSLGPLGHETLVQRAVKEAVRASGIAKRATCHGTDIRTLQELLGRADVATCSTDGPSASEARSTTFHICEPAGPAYVGLPSTPAVPWDRGNEKRESDEAERGAGATRKTRLTADKPGTGCGRGIGGAVEFTLSRRGV